MRHSGKKKRKKEQSIRFQKKRELANIKAKAEFMKIEKRIICAEVSLRHR